MVIQGLKNRVYMMIRELFPKLDILVGIKVVNISKCLRPTATRLVRRIDRKASAKPAQNQPRWAPKSSPNPQSWKSKSSRIGPKRPLGELLGDLGPKMAPRGLQERKCTKNPNIFDPLLEGKLEQKSIKNPSKSLLNPILTCILFPIAFCIEFCQIFL